MGFFDFFKKKRGFYLESKLESNTDKKYQKANNLIKKASELARKKDFAGGAKLIEQALCIYDQNEWRDKLANYYKKAGNNKDAMCVLKEMTAKEKGYIVNIGCGINELNRRRIWEDNAERKEVFQVIYLLKNILGGCCGQGADYLIREENIYKGTEASLLFDKYYNEIVEHWKIVNKKSNELNSYFYKNYLDDVKLSKYLSLGVESFVKDMLAKDKKVSKSIQILIKIDNELSALSPK